MADVNAEIGVSIDTSNALAQLKALQREIARFQTSVAKSSENAALAQRDLQRNFINGVNSIQGFSAELRTVKTTAESFTDSLEKNKFSMREYFRYSMASTKTFGRFFRTEFDTVNKTALENVKRLQTQYIKMGRDASGAMKAIAIMPTKLDLTDLSTQTQIAAQKQALFNQLVKQGSTNLLNFGKNTQWAGRQLMVGFTLPLVGLGAAASKTFMDMETAAIKFRKVYGDLFTPVEEREQAFRDIQELGREFTKYGIAVSETINLAADAAAAGFQGLDLQRQVTEATRLQVLGQIEQQQALETTISLQNAFELQSKDLAEAINFLNAVENQTVVALEDITIAIPKAAPTVRELGGDVKDLAFFMAAMKEGGINASQGANALKSGLASLINPTDKAREMMEGFGIDIDDIVNRNAGNLKQTIIEFAQALDGLTDLNRQRAIEQLFGKFQLARLSTLFTNVIRDGNQASRVLDLAGSSVEELAALAEGELGVTANSAMNKFRGAVENLKTSLAPIGQLFLEIITPFVKNIGDLFDRFNSLSAGTKKVIGALVIGIGAIAPVVLMTVGLFANFVANGIKGLMLLRNGYLRLTGQSKILSETTNYLTVEQQNALAAAASLEQSHMNLKQVFTGEAEAVRQLVAEYQRMITAQNTAAARFPAMMQPGFRVKGYSDGIVSVPGPKGAGDVVPAMVSPGEAIISAEMNEKYAPLVQGIIADNIPGFKKGTKNVSPSGTFSKDFSKLYGDIGRLWAAPSVIQRQTEATPVWSSLNDEIQAINSEVREYLETLGLSEEVIQQRLKNLTRIQASHIEKQTFTTPMGGQEREVKIWQAGNLQKDLGAINNFLNVVPKIAKSLDDAKIAELAGNLNISIDEFREELRMLEEGIHPSTQKSADVFLEIAKEGSSIDPTLARTKTEREDLERIKYQSIAGKVVMEKRAGSDYYDPESLSARAYDPTQDELALLQTVASVEKVKQQFAASFNISDEIATISGQNVQALQNAWNLLSVEQQEGLLRLKDDAPAFTAALLDEAQKAGIAGFELGSSAIQGIAKGTKAASPSQEAKQQGQNVSDGFEQGILEGQDDAAIAASKVKQAAITGFQQETIPFGVPVVPGPLVYEQQAIPFDFNAKTAPEVPQVATTEALEEFESVTFQAADMSKKSSQNMQKWNSRLMSGSFALSSITGLMSAFGKDMGGASDKIFKVSTSLFAFQSIVQLASQTMLADIAMRRVAMAKQASAFATYGTGIASRAGIMGLIGRIGIFAKTLLGLTNPLGIAINAAVIVGTAFFVLNKRAEANRKKIDGLGEAASATGKKIEGLADYFGVDEKKFAFETYDFNKAGGPILVPDQESEVQKVIKSDRFKDFKDDVEAIKNATAKEATLALESLAMGLEAKGFSREQVDIIVKAILKEAGRRDVVIDFASIDISSKEGKQAFEKRLSSTFNIFNKRLAKGVNDSFKKSLGLTSNTIANALGVLNLKFEGGAIGATEYAAQVKNINTQILAIKDSAQQANLIDAIFKSMGEEATKAASGISNVADRLLVMQALLFEVDAKLIKGLKSTDLLLQDISRRRINDELAEAFKVVQQNVEGLNKTNEDGINGGEKALTLNEKLIKIYEKERQKLEKKAEALKDVNDEISRQNQFIQDQMDLTNQITEAKISGNYLEAAALSQQKLMEQSEFRQETKEIELQKQIDRINNRISELEDKDKKVVLTNAEKRLLKIYADMFKRSGTQTGDRDNVADPTQPAANQKQPETVTQADLGIPTTSAAKNNKSIPDPTKVFNDTIKTKGYSWTIAFDTKSGKWIPVKRGSNPPGTISFNDWRSGKARTYKGGGPISGPGTSTSDSIPIWASNGEFMWSERAVENAGGANAVAAMHDYFKNAKGLKGGGEVDKKGNSFTNYFSNLNKQNKEYEGWGKGILNSSPSAALARIFAGERESGDILNALGAMTVLPIGRIAGMAGSKIAGAFPYLKAFGGQMYSGLLSRLPGAAGLSRTYHGGPSGISNFKKQDLRGWNLPGTYLTQDPIAAAQYAGDASKRAGISNIGSIYKFAPKAGEKISVLNMGRKATPELKDKLIKIVNGIESSNPEATSLIIKAIRNAKTVDEAVAAARSFKIADATYDFEKFASIKTAADSEIFAASGMTSDSFDLIKNFRMSKTLDRLSGLKRSLQDMGGGLGGVNMEDDIQQWIITNASKFVSKEMPIDPRNVLGATPKLQSMIDMFGLRDQAIAPYIAQQKIANWMNYFKEFVKNKKSPGSVPDSEMRVWAENMLQEVKYSKSKISQKVYEFLTGEMHPFNPKNIFGTSTLAAGGYIDAAKMASLPQFKTGIDNVPYDMPAFLHQGERVLTKEENQEYGTKTIINNNNFEITGDNPREITRLVMLELERVSNKNNKSNRVIA